MANKAMTTTKVDWISFIALFISFPLMELTSMALFILLSFD